MKLKKKVFSEVDSTIKYVFINNENFTMEFSYINKNDGKDIICAPSQTMCNMACKFCHCTDHIGKIKSQNVNRIDIIGGIEYIINDLSLSEDKMLLISFMGIGEPMMNYYEVVKSMIYLFAKRNEKNIRFAFATCLPKIKITDFFEFTNVVRVFGLPVKLHLSLHYTNDTTRSEWMPASINIEESLAATFFYKSFTKNKVEIHYALIDGLNDTEEDAIKLSNLLKDKDVDVKFLFFNEKESIDYHHSNEDRVNVFKTYLDAANIKFEYYIPPGLKIGASCGQFFMEDYIN